MTTEIIVGCGASALAHLYFAIKSSFTKKGTNVIVIGEDDLWKKISTNQPKHFFGQPAQIVHLVNTQPTVAKPQDHFQTAGEIDGQLEQMRDFLKEHNVNFVPDLVTRIERAGEKIQVTAVKTGVYLADRVIVATGFGRSALPRSRCPVEVTTALSNAARWGHTSATGMFQNRIMGATEYLYAQDVKPPPAHYKFRVAVQGSSATSSWAVMRALALARTHQKIQVTWITRSGFADANPAGRNNEILKTASDAGWLTRAVVDEISMPARATDFIRVVLAPAVAGERPVTDLTTLGNAYKSFYAESTRTREMAAMQLRIKPIRSRTTIYVDHFIYALGADPALPGGSGAIIAGNIKDNLQPVVDKDRRFDDDPNATTLAFRTDDGKVWIVGAGVFRAGGIKKLEKFGGKFQNIAAMMCEAGSPPEGIAAIIAGAKALLDWDENDSVRALNLHTADFKEIENWFSKIYEQNTRVRPSARTARAMADQIVAMRKHSVFGLSVQEIDRLGNPNDPFWQKMLEVDVETGVRAVDRLAMFAA
jgi:hypothetical protein